MATDDAMCGAMIEGDGVAAVCCARLLTDAGISCSITKTVRPKLAAVLLGEQTQHLLREIFATVDDTDDLFAGFTPIRRRIVRWGHDAQTIDLPHLGVVASEEELLRRLWQRVPLLPVSSSQNNVWQILSSRGSVSEAIELTYGSRQAYIGSTTLLPRVEEHACWVESVSAGWLFLLSLGGNSASLICVSDSADRALDESTLVAKRIGTRPLEWARASAFPRMLQPLAAPHWLACGTAAVTFDPLCGEGTGNAVREAFLASAVVQAALAGNTPESLAAHYSSRLQQGFLRHLYICLQFYSTGGNGDFWGSECSALRQGIHALEGSLKALPAPLYRLLDRTLVPIKT